MAFKVVLFTALVAAASAGNLGLDYAGTYGQGLGYSGLSLGSVAHHAPLAYSAPLVSTPAVAYSAPVTKTISHEPTISEYSTLVKTAPAIHSTRISQPAPIVHESYTAPIVQRSFEQAPIVQRYSAPAPVVQRSIAAPYVAPYLPAPLAPYVPAPVAHSAYSAPLVAPYGRALPYGPQVW